MEPNASHTNGRYSNDGVPDPDSVKLPEGHRWLSPAERIALRKFINRIVFSGQLPNGASLEVLEFGTYRAEPTVCLFLSLPAVESPEKAVAIHFHVFGWRPRVEMDAPGLHQHAEAAWQTSVQIDDMRGIAEEKVNLSQDVQARRFVSQRMNQAERALDRNCIPLMNAAMDVRNWINPIPPSAMIEGTWACGWRLSKDEAAR